MRPFATGDCTYFRAVFYAVVATGLAPLLPLF